MPVKQNSRLWDPSRRVPSTHRASPVRGYVYQQLGLSKPGFWADWRKRTIAEPEPEGYDEGGAPETEYTPFEYGNISPFQEEEPPKRAEFKYPKASEGAAPPPSRRVRTSGNLAGMLESQSQNWFKNNRLVDSFAMSAMGVAGFEKAQQNQELAAYLRGKGQGHLSYAGIQSVSQFYGMKAIERADMRASRPFAAGEPTNFDKMMDGLSKSKPIYEPPTYEILTQGTSKLPKSPETTIGQINVSQYGYVSNTLPPQKKVATALKGRIASGAVLKSATSRFGF